MAPDPYQKQNVASHVSSPTAPWYRRATLDSKVGVVIPTRNRAHFLPHMLGCLAVQSLKPTRILVVDDGGDDDTESVVRRYDGVEYLRAHVGQGISGNPARNVGLHQLADLPLLCFLDDDDMIPPNYLEQLTRVIQDDCRVGAAYPRLTFCGGSNRILEHTFDRDLLARTNLSGTPAVIRTDALMQVGGWPIFEKDDQGSVPHDDWALWRRLADHGWTMALGDVDYYYHRHDDGVCQSKARANHQDQWYRTVDPFNLVTVAVPFSGRAYLLDDFLAHLADQTICPERLHLLFYDNSGSPDFAKRLKLWSVDRPEYASVAYFKDKRPAVSGLPAQCLADAPLDTDGQGRRLHGRQLNHRVGAIWNRIGQLANTDLIWCLEDDVLAPPNTLETLLSRMSPTVDAVTASYPSRVVPDACVAWNYENRPPYRVVHLNQRTGVEQIGGCGFGCVLVRRELFRDGPARSAGEAIGFDCNFWLNLQQKRGKLLIDWDVQCEHRLRFEAINPKGGLTNATLA